MAFPSSVDVPQLPEPPLVSPLLVDLGPDEALVESDGVPLDTDWHRLAIGLLVESVKQWLRGRTDYYVGGNMFIYYREKPTQRRRFRGPDFFFIKGASRTPMRPYWVVWQEGGRFPNAIIELLSPSTEKEDRTAKKEIYEQVFRTPNFFCYDPDTRQLQGWRLNTAGQYEALVPNEHGWLWSEELGLWVGTWTGNYLGDEMTWLRFYDRDHRLVPTPAEAEQQDAEAARRREARERERAETERQRAETEHQQAEAERLRADTERLRADTEHRQAEAERQRTETERLRAEIEHQRAEAERLRADATAAELARLKALLARQGISLENSGEPGG
jgi:Uma2 family endonuclease